ncbi:UBX domain-containing protein [Drechslerella dactyloides]|uniref:UBX domain-containing protein n=1 Tax=Drechslerella dactyloides TaxID=74499 RepID=A0AAD6NMB6_DREDA|nr:UBX domain-containing protein [Drechslerella dactyloides]
MSSDALTDAQQAALAQYTAVTNQDAAAATALLRRCQWNVEIAITRFFDGEPAVDPVAEAQAQEAAARAAQREQLRNAANRTSTSTSTSTSSSSADLTPAPRVVPQPPAAARRPNGVFTLILLPFSIAWRLTSGVAYLFSTLFPFLPRLLSNFYSPLHRRPGGASSSSSATTRRALSPRDTASRFIREFEEENGVTGLPWFEGGYAAALDLAKQELKFLLVVLLSPEHDDTAAYCRETLANPDVVKFVKDRDIVLWGGSVADSEAYQVSTALQCTKFPFAALITHTPQASATAMSVVTRIVGLTPPQTFVQKLTAAIAAHSDALTAVRTRRAAEAADRSIRDEQNRAYEASLARDAERARVRRAEEAARAKAEMEEKEALAAAEREERRLAAWRRWRGKSLKSEPAAGGDTCRIALVMGDGTRVVRRFTVSDTIEDVYAFVDTVGVTVDDGEAADEDPELLEGYEHEYGFRLVSNMPRRVYDAEEDKTVGERFGRSVALIVEPVGEEGDDDEEDEEEE